jgi:RimJ/RimL family protein N-acetyltransferase
MGCSVVSRIVCVIDSRAGGSFWAWLCRCGLAWPGVCRYFTRLAIPQLLPEVMPAIEIGWRLRRAFWGRGPATEAAAAALRFCLIDRDLGQIISIAQAGSGASERIMGKLCSLAWETVDPTCNRPVRVYAITGARYLAAGPRSSGDRMARRHVSVLSGKVWVACIS